jgi:hypothetical protein
MRKESFEKGIQWLITGILVLLVIGIPAVFTSYTRSVFEINKFLLLRVSTLLVMGIWFFYSLVLKANSVELSPSEDRFTLFGFSWKKIGFELPMLAWFAFNLLSTVFSQNVKLSVIGAYDRWEGIFSVINYGVLWFIFAKWIRSIRQFHLIVSAILVSTLGSAIYGVFQSKGIDFMHWSVDASQRVFACINNPVHFCAYMGMVVLLVLGWMLYGTDKILKNDVLKWVGFPFVMGATLLVYYAQFLSFSRATWLGFSAGITFFYMIAFWLYNGKTFRHFLVDFFLTILGISAVFMISIFKVNTLNMAVFVGVAGILISYIIFSLFYCLDFKVERLIEDKVNTLLLAGGLILLGVLYLVDFPETLPFISVLIAGAGILGLISFKISSHNLRAFLARCVIIVMFAKLQFTASYVTFILYLSLVVALYFLTRPQQNSSAVSQMNHRLLVGFSLALGCVLVAPTLNVDLMRVISKGSASEVTAIENAKLRSEMYASSLGGKSARISMWKSSVPWIKDYWLLGSGLDTIKFMYPKYRRADYGILEGGHNFTPDRLHNEYINSLATRGVPATLLFYGVLILGWFVMVLRSIYHWKDSPKRFLLLGILSGATVYLGQVLFNFGVVATLFLFYVLLGLGHAVSLGEKNGEF